MRIDFQRTGGFGGMAMERGLTLDTAHLPAAEAQELASLLARAGPEARQPRSAAPAGPARDLFHYTLTFEEHGRRWTIEASDADLPEPLRALIRWLLDRATPA